MKHHFINTFSFPLARQLSLTVNWRLANIAGHICACTQANWPPPGRYLITAAGSLGCFTHLTNVVGNFQPQKQELTHVNNRFFWLLPVCVPAKWAIKAIHFAQWRARLCMYIYTYIWSSYFPAAWEPAASLGNLLEFRASDAARLLINADHQRWLMAADTLPHATANGAHPRRLIEEWEGPQRGERKEEEMETYSRDERMKRLRLRKKRRCQ